MFRLLFETCYLFVHCIAGGLLYAAGALFFFFSGIAVVLVDSEITPTPIAYIAVLMFLFLIANTLYIYATAKHMLHPGDPIDYFSGIRWRKAHNDFFVFIGIGMFLIAVIVVYFYDSFSYIMELTDTLKQEKVEMQINRTSPLIMGSLSVLLLGSQLLSSLLLFASLFLWTYLCRIGLRIPAHADGYYIRAKEALELTNGHSIPIIALSLLFLSATFFFVDVACARLLPDDPAAWQYAAAFSAGYFVLMQLHIALWVCLYKDKTRGYKLNPLVI